MIPGKARGAWGVLLLLSVFAGAFGQSDPPKGLAPLPALPAQNQAEVELGRRLFFDPRLSGDATISCATCHLPEKGYADALPLSKGYPASLYFRNTPSLYNSAFKKKFYWDGRLPGNDLPTVVRDHLSEAHFMQADGRLIIERLRQIPEYEERFRTVYKGDPSYGRILNAISAYVRSLVSQDAPIDRFLQGKATALSESARRGVILFTGKAACVRCHGGPMLTDERSHNLGVPDHPGIFEEPERHITFRRFMKTLGVPGYHRLERDIGLAAITALRGDEGKFKTPSLREVSRTAPYMHNGMFATLEEVVAFYNRGGGDGSGKDPDLVPLGLSPEEAADLVAFLRALAGTERREEPPPLPEYTLRGEVKREP